uniref:Mariner Mos1 transposase n=1 Tax=Bactrocera dorsalis TaxID=27457 RepID=A0A034VCE1_BACDO
MELNISKTSIYCILTEHLGLREVCSRFVPHKLSDDQKLLRIQHSKDIIKEVKKDKNFLYNIVTGGETWCFQYYPMEKSNVKTMLICFYDSKGIVHKEFVPPGQNVNAVFYLKLLKRLVRRIRRVRPEYSEDESWRLLWSHRSTLVTDYLTKNHILTINHSPYSPDMAPCDFFLFGKMHLPMKGKRYADVEAVQKDCTDILAAIPADELKHSFDMLLDRAKSCIEAEGDYFE